MKYYAISMLRCKMERWDNPSRGIRECEPVWFVSVRGPGVNSGCCRTVRDGAELRVECEFDVTLLIKAMLKDQLFHFMFIAPLGRI